MEIEIFNNFEQQQKAGSNYDYYYNFEQPSFVFKITDFNNQNDEENLSNDEKKEYYELKPVEAPLVRRLGACYDHLDDFRIEDIISEKTILDYDHEIETSSYDYSYDENSYDENWDYFDLSHEMNKSGRHNNNNGDDDDDDDSDIMMLTPYQCSKCSETFHMSQHLYVHLQEVHQHEMNYKCFICDEIFDNPNSLTNHMRSHKDIKRPFVCNDCGKKFKTYEYLENHKLNKMCNSDANICAVCGKEFKNQFNLVRHRTVHSNDRPFKCSICGKMFKQQDNLNVHVRCHKSERPFKCKKCPKAYRDLDLLERHKQLQHKSILFHCNICKKAFRLLIHLQKHMRMHAEKPHRCPQCKKGYRTEDKLNRHIETHNGIEIDDIKCRICLREFPNPGYLIRHMVTHQTTKKSKKSSQGDNRLKSSSTSSQSSSPLPNVTPVKVSNKCDVCNKYFNDPDELVNHAVDHEKNRPFKCKNCVRRFKTAGYLRKHRRAMHREEFYNELVEVEAEMEKDSLVGNKSMLSFDDETSMLDESLLMDEETGLGDESSNITNGA